MVIRLPLLVAHPTKLDRERWEAGRARGDVYRRLGLSSRDTAVGPPSALPRRGPIVPVALYSPSADP
jgi:hypothetical protein